ncbi:MAG: VCBS repeat-containing protein [Chloroflexi bacterium]|nr:VCBS repeat-containing protein [Chloroflexota bacterium]
MFSVLHGHGDGTFDSEPRYLTGKRPGGVVVADFNFDGKLDVATTGQAGVGSSANEISVRLGNGDGTPTRTPL